MLRGFWKLTWLETKIFMREPMGVFATLGFPVILFVVLGRVMTSEDLMSMRSDLPDPGPQGFSLDQAPFNVPVLAVLLIAISAVLSLIAIMSIYREGGILKRLRATPLSPVTILGAHVVVKLAFTLASLVLLLLAGRQFFPGAMDVPLLGFTLALLLSTLSILSLGFIIASVVPTARFAQPIGAAFVYPMLVLSGLFFPLDQLPRPLEAVAYLFPTTHAVTLMDGVWDGAGWFAHWTSVLALIAIFAASVVVSTRLFRWE